MSFTFLNELPSPAQIQERYPLSEKLQELKKQRDAEISNVIKGLDNRFLVIIGPCSADNEDSVCDYVSRNRISSGPEEIMGNNKADLQFQLRIKF
jgi:3-deoxy-7-phosphoheptulonate synthase